ncbi:methyltransferase domain-containing protein [Candidatus Woesearchaeota archaeon]|nr:methyltransferase domain-containing protein [Candidatus Woesearchaeota archaeon]
MASKKALEKHSRADELYHSAEDIRWATPEVVADYRAKRLQCKTIVDVGCGIGFQTFAFAKKCDHVFAIDIDPEKIEKAEKNAAVLWLKNITFIAGDALSPQVIRQLKNVDIVFCDPARLPEETERTTATIQPNISELLRLYGKLTDRIAIEFPPQIQEIPFACEREYLSWQGKLNRLNLYFGGLKKSERSAVTLPTEEQIVPQKGAVLREVPAPQQYLFDVDPAVVKAGLLAELSAKTGAALLQRGKNIVFTAPRLVKDAFFVHVYKILETVSFEQKLLLRALRKQGAGTIILRYSIDPNEYAAVRRSLEKELKGQKVVCLFRLDDQALITEEVR